jgi:hypothetical protein
MEAGKPTLYIPPSSRHPSDIIPKSRSRPSYQIQTHPITTPYQENTRTLRSSAKKWGLGGADAESTSSWQVFRTYVTLANPVVVDPNPANQTRSILWWGVKNYKKYPDPTANAKKKEPFRKRPPRGFTGGETEEMFGLLGSEPDLVPKAPSRFSCDVAISLLIG